MTLSRHLRVVPLIVLWTTIVGFTVPFLVAQDSPPQEMIRTLRTSGNKRTSDAEVKGLFRMKEGRPFSDKEFTDDKDRLLRNNTFEAIEYRKQAVADQPGWVDVTLLITEFDQVATVEILGAKTQKAEDLEKGLIIKKGDLLYPFRLKADRDYLRDHYRKEGYAFVDVSHEVLSRDSGVHLKWHVREGPRVTVDEILFIGNTGHSDSKLKSFMVTEENGFFTSKPYVKEVLAADVERLKMAYYKEGWLDIMKPGSFGVFVQSVRFNDDRTRATITLRVEEGRRYKLRKVAVTGNRIFKDEEIIENLKSKPGDYITDGRMRADVEALRNLYGERAYLNVEIHDDKVFSVETAEVDLTYRIVENEKVYVGNVIIQGNSKTRDDVIRREVHIYPGEEYNRRELKRGIDRLGGTQWFVPVAQGGIRYELQDTDDPSVKDLMMEVKETETGRFHFGGGFSSGFGLIGFIDFTQRNFDLADPPKSLEDMFSGNAFAGGGQSLRIRLSPGAKRSSYGADFREPYVFGEDVGLRLRGFKTVTIREAYDEDRFDASIGLDKRWGDLKIGTSLQYLNVDIGGLETEAPSRIRSLEGDNAIYSIIPSIQYDTRDAPMFTTSGFNFQLSYEYAGGFLPGDFDYGKTILRSSIHHPVYKTDMDRFHVISAEILVGVANEFGDTHDVPYFEKFYAGGRGTIRGFKFRGIGPRESGVPLGDDALVFGSVEYSFPVYSDMMRGAFFYDVADLAPTIGKMHADEFRMSTGFGVRFMVPFLSQIPVSLDFGFPIELEGEDRRKTITFDIGWF